MITLAQYRAPALHRMVGGVAESAEQEPPARIYLAPDVNAAVFQQGGLLGFGGKRVLLVGLPLIDTLTVRQLRAVIAHEFGHFYGGDTRLGPWFYRTYDALERTVIALHEAESICRKPSPGCCPASTRCPSPSTPAAPERSGWPPGWSPRTAPHRAVRGDRAARQGRAERLWLALALR